MKDSLGDRMKGNYEDRTRQKLMRRSYTIIRIDGKAFHTYTKGLTRPFDEQLVNDMNATTVELCSKIQGCKLGYVQSDEISLLLTDFDDLETSAWYDNNIQKIVSVSASIATGVFNQLRPGKLAFFDSRVFQVPTKDEAINYFIWRQQDATRNSISSVAQSLYSHKELNGVSTKQMQELIFQKGINWDKYDAGLKRGRLISKKELRSAPTASVQTSTTVWCSEGAPIFTREREVLNNIIPNNN